MDKYYYLCEFEYGYLGSFYQEVQNGCVIRLVDITGVELVVEGEYGYHITETTPYLNLFS